MTWLIEYPSVGKSSCNNSFFKLGKIFTHLNFHWVYSELSIQLGRLVTFLIQFHWMMKILMNCCIICCITVIITYQTLGGFCQSVKLSLCIKHWLIAWNGIDYHSLKKIKIFIIEWNKIRKVSKRPSWISNSEQQNFNPNVIGQNILRPKSIWVIKDRWKF